MDTRNKPRSGDPSYDIDGETNAVVLDKLIIMLS